MLHAVGSLLIMAFVHVSCARGHLAASMDAPSMVLGGHCECYMPVTAAVTSAVPACGE